MKANIIDLRYKMKDVLLALERSEIVQILYHGKLKGTIIPAIKKSDKRMEDHPFFGMFKGEEGTVEEKMNALRGGRYDAL